MKTGLTVEELKDIVNALNVNINDIIRKKDKLLKNLNLIIKVRKIIYYII